MAKLQVRLKSAWTERFETPRAVFSRDLPAQQADALLCEWAPDDELFSFRGRKAWYCCEPACQLQAMKNGLWLKTRDSLAAHEFLWHGHPEIRYRVPHITHFETLTTSQNEARRNRAIAVVSNYGGNPWHAHRDILYRNALITSPLVDLYGRSNWNRYREIGRAHV